jgi:hypothetical protein
VKFNHLGNVHPLDMIGTKNRGAGLKTIARQCMSVAVVIWFFSDSDGLPPNGGTFVIRGFVLFAAALVISGLHRFFQKRKTNISN